MKKMKFGKYGCHFLTAILVATSLSLLIVSPTKAEDTPVKYPDQYTVEMEMSSAGQKTTTKMFVDGKKTRMEMPDGSGGELITISRPDKNMIYSLIPAPKKYMENSTSGFATNTATEPKTKWELLGEEDIEGKTCEKYKVTTEFEIPGIDSAKQSVIATYYLDKSTHYPIRISTGEGAMSSVTTYKNWQIGSPDSSLFEIPSDYTKLSVDAGIPTSPEPQAEQEE